MHIVRRLASHGDSPRFRGVLVLPMASRLLDESPTVCFELSKNIADCRWHDGLKFERRPNSSDRPMLDAIGMQCLDLWTSDSRYKTEAERNDFAGEDVAVGDG